MASNTVNIRDLEVYEDFNHNGKNYKNVVKTVHYTIVSGETGKRFDGSFEINESIRTFKNFTAFENLTDKKVCDWVINNVNWETINKILNKPKVVNKKPPFLKN